METSLWLLEVLALFGLITPAVAYYSRIIYAVIAVLFAFLGMYTALVLYSIETDQALSLLWYGIAWINLANLMLSIIALILKLSRRIRDMKLTLKTPREII